MPPTFTRRSASVTICACACCTAALINSWEYLPEPKMKREVNSYLPNFQVSFAFTFAFVMIKTSLFF